MANIVEITVLARNATKEGFAAAEGESASFSSKMQKVGLIGAAALAAVAVASVDMATEFQSSTTRLVTSAGESTKNIDMVRKGMLAMAGQVGISANELAKGMYTVESGGYHGAAGLTVLKAAAQGAKDENADLGTVANAVTDVLTDYHMKASAAADVTSKLVTAVSFGKTNFEDFSQSMSNVLPLAGAMHLSLADVSGVLAEMTAHGVSAQRASENEANAMRELAAPTGTMVKEFKLFGITTQDVQNKLGSVGLGGTMEWLRGIADKNAGSVGQTQTGAFKKLLGSAAALSVGLMTTGENFKSTQAAIAGISGATADAQGNVKGFSEVQKTFKQQLSEVGASAESLAISFGDKMLPALTATIGWMAAHQGTVEDIAKAVLAVVAALATYAIVAKTVAIAQEILNAVLAMNPFVAIAIGVVAVAAIVIKYHTQIWNFIVKTWTDIVGFLNTSGNDISGFFIRIWNDIFNTTRDIWNRIMGFIRQWWPLFIGIATGGLGLLVGTVIKFHSQIWNTIVSVWNRILGFIKGLGSTLFGIGSDIFTALWNGIKAVGGSIIGWVSGWAGNVIGPIKDVINWISSAIGWLGNLGSSSGKVSAPGTYPVSTGKAAGGAVAGGWTVVGEHGRELVRLPGGSSVMPAGNTATMLAAGGGGGLHITLELGQSFRQAGLTEQQLEDLRYTVRTKGGGDVQRALGVA